MMKKRDKRIVLAVLLVMSILLLPVAVLFLCPRLAVRLPDPFRSWAYLRSDELTTLDRERAEVEAAALQELVRSDASFRGVNVWGGVTDTEAGCEGRMRPTARSVDMMVWGEVPTTNALRALRKLVNDQRFSFPLNFVPRIATNGQGRSNNAMQATPNGAPDA